MKLGAAGSNELIYCLMMQHNFIAPNINVEEIDPECEGINLVANQACELGSMLRPATPSALAG